MAEWELQEILDNLRRVPGSPGPSHVSIDLRDDDGNLLPCGAALLALLEIESCKRRIEAAGWLWSEAPATVDFVPVYLYGVPGPPVDFGERGESGTPGIWRAAAEYAEAHAQGVLE